MTVVLPRAAAAVAALGLMLALTMALASPASANHDRRCFGVTKAGKADADTGTFPLEYRFHCQERILGYTLISSADREIAGFEAELQGFDAQGNVRPSDAFSCEGDIPAIGINCFGIYTANNGQIQSTLEMQEDPCAEPRPELSVIVTLNSVDAQKNHTPASTSKGEMAGPFSFGRPRGCKQKSSELKGLLAWVELIRKELRAASRNR